MDTQTKRALLDGFEAGGYKFPVPPSEVADILDSPAGPVVTTTDGVTYVLDRVNGDENAEWKIMRTADDKVGGFAIPVFVPPAPEEFELNTPGTRRSRRKPKPGSREEREAAAANDLATGPREDDNADDDVNEDESLEAKVREREGDLDNDASLEELVAQREGDPDASLEAVAHDPGEERDSGVVDLSQLNKEQLLTLARIRGVDVKPAWGEARIREAIEDASTS